MPSAPASSISLVSYALESDEAAALLTQQQGALGHRRWAGLAAVAALAVAGVVMAVASAVGSRTSNIRSRAAHIVSESTNDWKLVFRQTLDTDGFYSFKNATGAPVLRVNPNDADNDNFAILDEIEGDYPQGMGNDGWYYFKLSWPDDDLEDMIWKQTSNPVTHQGYGVENYSVICVPYDRFHWAGLEPHTSEPDLATDLNIMGSMMDGSVNDFKWWYAVGAFETYKGGIPGPGSIVSKTELYVNPKGTAKKCGVEPTPKPTPAPTKPLAPVVAHVAPTPAPVVVTTTAVTTAKPVLSAKATTTVTPAEPLPLVWIGLVGLLSLVCCAGLVVCCIKKKSDDKNDNDSKNNTQNNTGANANNNNENNVSNDNNDNTANATTK